jgi:hypothetical protein
MSPPPSSLRGAGCERPALGHAPLAPEEERRLVCVEGEREGVARAGSHPRLVEEGARVGQLLSCPRGFRRFEQQACTCGSIGRALREEHPALECKSVISDV